jgi:hypothetical protein
VHGCVIGEEEWDPETERCEPVHWNEKVAEARKKVGKARLNLKLKEL